MSHLSTLWSIAIAALFIIFIFSIVQHFRHETGHSGHFMEWDNQDDIHYEEDEE